MRYLQLMVSLSIALWSGGASAWDDQGHMMVAAIAWDHLTPSSKSRAIELLKLNPDYAAWIAGVPQNKQDEMAFVTAATWPDKIKADPAYTNDGENASVPNANLNIGYQDHLQHRYWHYVDLPFSKDGTALVQPQSPNAETQIEAFRTAINSATVSDNIKSYDLVWLLHLVGDVHQPLHATSRFSNALPHGDRGGNSVTLCKKPCRSELHAFWDDVLGTSKSPTVAISAAGRLPAAPTSLASIADDHTWIQESFETAKQSVYKSPIGASKGPYKITSNYKTSARAVAKQRVALAGSRLAALIDNNLR